MPLSYSRFGSGTEPILLLPDWFGGRAFLEGMMAWIDADRFSYVIPDYRGYLGCRDAQGRFDLAEMLADAIELVNHLGWRTFHVAGHSMSGKVVTLLAALHADRIKSAVALTPTPPMAMAYDEATWTLLTRCENDVDSRRLVLDAATGSRYGEAIVARLAGISMQAAAPAAFRKYLDAWAKTDIRSQLHEPAARLHIILGALDPFVPESVIRESIMAIFSRAQLTVLPDVGHYPPLEAPLRTAALLEGIFRESA